jgi:hypothetical protein
MENRLAAKGWRVTSFIKTKYCRPDLWLRTCLGVLFIMALPLSGLAADDQISVKRDQDKTVYTIGPDTQNRQEEEKERDKAWDMLKNMRIYDGNRQQLPQAPATQGR